MGEEHDTTLPQSWVVRSNTNYPGPFVALCVGSNDACASHLCGLLGLLSPFCCGVLVWQSYYLLFSRDTARHDFFMFLILFLRLSQSYTSGIIRDLRRKEHGHLITCVVVLLIFATGKVNTLSADVTAIVDSCNSFWCVHSWRGIPTHRPIPQSGRLWLVYAGAATLSEEGDGWILTTTSGCPDNPDSSEAGTAALSVPDRRFASSIPRRARKPRHNWNPALDSLAGEPAHELEGTSCWHVHMDSKRLNSVSVETILYATVYSAGGLLGDVWRITLC